MTKATKGLSRRAFLGLGATAIESEAVPATVKPVNEKQLSPCHCFLCKKWEGAFQGEARKPARSEHR